MYINSNYDDFNYLVEAHDNYLILSKNSRILGESGDKDIINVYYQYLTPSFLGFETTYESYETKFFTDISEDFSTDFWERSDAPIIFICQFLLCFVIVFIFNQLSKFVKKGGIFGGLS